MKNKNKLSDVQLLQIEKKRLQEICVLYEAKMKAHIEELRHDSFNMAMHSILPFEDGTKSKAIRVIKLLNKTLLPLFFGVSFGKGKGNWTRTILKLMRPVLIALSFKLFRKIFAKRKRKPA